MNYRRSGAVAAVVAIIVASIWMAWKIPDATLLTIVDKEIYAAAVPVTAFPFLYTYFFRWWKEPLGRALFIEGTGMCLLIDVSVAYRIWPSAATWHTIEIAFLIFTTVTLGMFYRLMVMVVIWWGGRSDRKQIKNGRGHQEHGDLPPVPTEHRLARDVTTL